MLVVVRVLLLLEVVELPVELLVVCVVCVVVLLPVVLLVMLPCPQNSSTAKS